MARQASGRVRSIPMTEGSLWKNIFLFSVPLIFSQLLQVLFNMADVAVVGKFASSTALGSVGSTTTLVTLFTGYLIGMGCGVNVRVAQHLGAGQEKQTQEAVHTSLLLCTLAGLIITVLCLTMAEPMLKLLKTKDDLIDGAVLYFRIYALGMPALGIFNFGNAVLSANGDTKRPLVYLTIAGVLNVILNLFFVIVCKMAADGVALASILSQYLSAVLIIWHMLRLEDSCRLIPRCIRFHKEQVGRILALGIPAGVQNMIFAIANLFIQVGVNSFDSIMVSGNSAAANTDSIVYNVMAAFHTACSSFMGQNWGAGNRERMIKKLPYQPVVFVPFRRADRPDPAVFRRRLPVYLHKRPGCRCCRHAENAHHVLLLCHQRLHGLHHRGLPRHRTELCTDGDRHSRLLCVPRHLGLYDIRPFPYDPFAVSAVCVLVGHHGTGGDHLLPVLLPEAQCRPDGGRRINQVCKTSCLSAGRFAYSDFLKIRISGSRR